MIENDRWINPNRIQTSREARGLSKADLALRIGVSSQQVTNYERGADQPKPERLALIAAELNFPKSYFYGSDLVELPPEAITFRSRRSLTQTLRRQAIARSKHATCLISPAFRARFRLPEHHLPDLSGESPEDAARMMREIWNLGEAPIDNVVHLLEANGIEFYWLSIDSPCVDALSYWHNQRPFIFLNSFKHAGERGRFDAAHELGHLILHRHEDDMQSKKVEQEADDFASAFLLPRAQFTLEAPRSTLVSDYLRLKPRWKTSIAAMVRRSYDLGLISRYAYENSFKLISARGWRTSEPAELSRERSAVHLTILERLSAKGIGPSEIAAEIGLGFTDFFELVPSSVYFESPLGGIPVG
jgi:Zn-dependent peptidase ImmA (M78 family)/DNA-binding XRE family transcriptional regulator